MGIFEFVAFGPLHALSAKRGHSAEALTGLRAGNAERLGGCALIDDLDEDWRVAVLLKSCWGRPSGDFQAGFRIQLNAEENMRSEGVLDGLGILGLDGSLEAREGLGGQWGAKELERLQDAADVGGERLSSDGNCRFSSAGKKRRQ